MWSLLKLKKKGRKPAEAVNYPKDWPSPAKPEPAYPIKVRSVKLPGLVDLPEEMVVHSRCAFGLKPIAIHSGLTWCHGNLACSVPHSVFCR